MEEKLLARIVNGIQRYHYKLARQEERQDIEGKPKSYKSISHI
jgi:hypothetical protein